MSHMTEPQKHPGGRPPIDVDVNTVRKLARRFSTKKDIAQALHVDFRTFNKLLHTRPDIYEAYEQGRSILKNKLRGWQVLRAYQESHGGASGCTMLIWLGKQILDQRDLPTSADETDECLIVKPDGSVVIETASTGETRTPEVGEVLE